MPDSRPRRGRRTLPVLPLKNTVVFPQVLVPLAVARPRSLRLLDELPAGNRTMAVTAQLDDRIEEAGWTDVHHVGTVVRVQHLVKLPDGTVQLAVHGLERVRLVRAVSDEPYLVATLQALPEPPFAEPAGVEHEALV